MIFSITVSNYKKKKKTGKGSEFLKMLEQTNQHGLSAAYVPGVTFMDSIIAVNTWLHFSNYLKCELSLSLPSPFIYEENNVVS